jgi:hypothetical protein
MPPAVEPSPCCGHQHHWRAESRKVQVLAVISSKTGGFVEIFAGSPFRETSSELRRSTFEPQSQSARSPLGVLCNKINTDSGSVPILRSPESASNRTRVGIANLAVLLAIALPGALSLRRVVKLLRRSIQSAAQVGRWDDKPGMPRTLTSLLICRPFERAGGHCPATAAGEPRGSSSSCDCGCQDCGRMSADEDR